MMNAIRIRKQIDSETLHLPELKDMIGKTVEIIVLEETAAPTPTPPVADCFKALEGDVFDPRELEALRPYLTKEQYEALGAVASQGGPDVNAVAAIRAASMI
jgi:hypothetical protein